MATGVLSVSFWTTTRLSTLLAILAAMTPALTTTATNTTTTTTPTTTADPARCNGLPPPPGVGASVTLLAPGVLTYTCHPGWVQKPGFGGASVIHCDANTSLWTPEEGLVCEIPARCNGLPPPPAVGASITLLATGVLTYTCHPGWVQKPGSSGASVIHCDVNATSWTPGKGLECELPARCNGLPPPPGVGAGVTMLAPGVLTYTCHPGWVQIPGSSGASVIHCDVNTTSWNPKNGLMCELPVEEEFEVPPWLIVVAVAIVGSAVFVTFLFLVAYACRWCGICPGSGGGHESRGCCKSCQRHARVTSSPSHVVQPTKMAAERQSEAGHTKKDPVASIYVYDDYLVQQKRFL